MKITKYKNLIEFKSYNKRIRIEKVSEELYEIIFVRILKPGHEREQAHKITNNEIMYVVRDKVLIHHVLISKESLFMLGELTLILKDEDLDYIDPETIK